MAHGQSEPVLLDATDASSEQTLWQEIVDGFDTRFNFLGYATVVGVRDSVRNPQNVLRIPKYRAELDVRPDFYLDFRRLSLMFKPRWQLRFQEWKDGIPDGESDTEDEAFVNEWSARFRLMDELFVSYGRENLQWGPSYLVSPSNPFNQNNGRNNPMIEVPGADYGRVIWVPSSTFTASFIANVDEGRVTITEEFKNIYALKLDLTGEEKYASLIVSHEESRTDRFGGFASWEFVDGMRIYAEGAISDKKEDRNSDGQALGGFAYTFAMGPTLALEYYYQEAGCTLEPIARCAARPNGLIATKTKPLLRENYGLVQYSHSRINGVLNIVFRAIYGFDDDSARGIGIFEYEVGDYVQLFFVGDVFTGDEEKEFGSLFEYTAMLGCQVTF